MRGTPSLSQLSRAAEPAPNAANDHAVARGETPELRPQDFVAGLVTLPCEAYPSSVVSAGRFTFDGILIRPL